MKKIHTLPIEELVSLHKSKQQSIYDTVASSLEVIQERNTDTNAVIWSDQKYIDEQIKSIIDRDSNDTSLDSRLLGLPIVVKEIDSQIAGTPNSYGNLKLKQQQYCDTQTSLAIQLLINAGAIIVGKTNNPELALSITTDSKAHGPCLNPYDTTRNSGGSSGGSASAVASGMTSIAIGSDGGGSIRVPSSLCGIYGLKPSRGLIKETSDETSWANLTTRGVMGKRISDIAQILDVISNSTDFYVGLTNELPDLRIALRLNGFANLYEVNPAISNAIEKFAQQLSSMGHIIVEDTPTVYDDESIYEHFLNIIAYSISKEIISLSELTGSKLHINECDSLTQFFYNQGTNTTDEMYNVAVDKVKQFGQKFNSFFDNYDVLITPTTADYAPLNSEIYKDTPTTALIYGGLCFPANLAGAPALNVPILPDSSSGLPCGLQLIGPHSQDALLLQLASNM